jgi:hypothetical protein
MRDPVHAWLTRVEDRIGRVPLNLVALAFGFGFIWAVTRLGDHGAWVAICLVAVLVGTYAFVMSRRIESTGAQATRYRRGAAGLLLLSAIAVARLLTHKYG